MSFNEANFEKKLQQLQVSQESVQTLSLWCMHHKDQCATMVNLWLKCFRSSPSKHRMTLMYLANDICHAAHRKKLEQFSQQYLPALKEAFVLLRGDSYQKNAERILKIWEERAIYEVEYIEQLRSLLTGYHVTPATNAPATMSNGRLAVKDKSTVSGLATQTESSPVVTEEADNSLANFKLETFTAELSRFHKLEKSVERAQALLPTLKFDPTSNLRHHLKDRSHGQRITTEVQDAHAKLVEFVADLERHVNQRGELVKLLEVAESFYETQLNEAKIVENAYSTFGSRVEQVKRQLDEMKANLPSSPPRDAPSPTPYDDPFAQGVEAVALAAKKDGAEHLESVDMDLEDDGLNIVMNQSFLPSSRTKVDARTKKSDGRAGTPTLDEQQTRPFNPAEFLNQLMQKPTSEQRTSSGNSASVLATVNAQPRSMYFPTAPGAPPPSMTYFDAIRPPPLPVVSAYNNQSTFSPPVQTYRPPYEPGMQTMAPMPPSLPFGSPTNTSLLEPSIQPFGFGGGFQQSNYLQDFTSNPDEIDDMLLRGSNQQNLRVLSGEAAPPSHALGRGGRAPPAVYDAVGGAQIPTLDSNRHFASKRRRDDDAGPYGQAAQPHTYGMYQDFDYDRGRGRARGRGRGRARPR